MSTPPAPAREEEESQDSESIPRDLAESVGEFLNVYGQIKRLGLHGWIVSQHSGARFIDEDLTAFVTAFDADLDGLEFESDLEDAQRAAESRPRN